jgi:hypothetical protein
MCEFLVIEDGLVFCCFTVNVYYKVKWNFKLTLELIIRLMLKCFQLSNVNLHPNQIIIQLTILFFIFYHC